MMLTDNEIRIVKAYSEKIAFLEEQKTRLADENERVRAELSVKKKLLNNAAELVENIKADTVRKMQERLKMCFGTYVLGYKIPLTEVLKVINQIAKKMLEVVDDNT